MVLKPTSSQDDVSLFFSILNCKSDIWKLNQIKLVFIKSHLSAYCYARELQRDACFKAMANTADGGGEAAAVFLGSVIFLVSTLYSS